ncbi:leucine zipper domain-containing protein, partial [Candidatus Collinsella stercoripullorum]|uniref:leucine zipper domain-containing protein n=1 Tax=Candidatus Collinsella stercoripullorum TaxID=2838522 RepID=UPI002FD95E1C
MPPMSPMVLITARPFTRHFANLIITTILRSRRRATTMNQNRNNPNESAIGSFGTEGIGTANATIAPSAREHANARLTPRGRETLVSRVAAGEGVSSVARQMGVSRQTASKWLSRARRGETMSDRSCRPHRLARLTPPDAEARVREARSSMLLAPLALAAATGVP